MFGLTDKDRELLEEVRDALQDDEEVTDDEARGYTEQIIDLKKKIADLEISQAKKQEDFDRRDRELTHMIGLEKKRQEVEVEQAKKEATLAVREANLAADRKRFEDTIATNKKALEDGFGYMRDVLGKVLDRLPTVTVNRTK